MKHKLSGLVTVFILLLVFAATGYSADYKPEYRMSIVVGPVGPWGESAAHFAEAVKNATDGRVNIKPYYNGQLFEGKQTNEFLLMKQGVIDFALGSTINWSPTIKELNIFSLPFFFSGYSALDAVEYGETGKQLFKIIEENGVVGLGWAENGFRDLTNSKRPVKQPEDIEGLRIRVVGSPIFIDTFKAMSAKPVSMDWNEALSAFRKGTVDGQENPVVSVVIPNKLWQMHKYMTVWNYAIDPIILGVSKQVWDTFDRKDKDAIRKAAEETAMRQKKAAREGLEGSTAAFDTLKKNGMEITTLTPAQIKAFKNKTKAVYDKWRREVGTELVKTAEKDIQKAAKKK
jgi:tripartite ATP-independent transporter DctP family solute receptor